MITQASNIKIESGGPRIPWLLYLAPALVFVALTGILAWGLSRDPRTIPSAMIGRPVPHFHLPPVKGRSLGLSDADLKGEVSLVNVFASWCVACREEHPLLLNLKDQDIVRLHGLDYKDPPDDAARWLNTYGDPYAQTGAGTDGRVGIDWGVYGVPETFVVGKDGRIAHKHIGPLAREVPDRTILPLVERLRQQ